VKTPVRPVDAFHKAEDDAAFPAAFAASKFTVPPKARKTYEPVKPLIPWYLDKNSGGKNPLVRKPSIDYGD
jgi:hypothetical protein